LAFNDFAFSENFAAFSASMTFQFPPTVTRDKRSPTNTPLSPSLTTQRGRKQKSLTVEEWKELYEWRIYILYRQAVDY
jgi:hypothetical protein